MRPSSTISMRWNRSELTRLTLRLAVQGPLAADFSGITYNADRDLLVASTPTALGDLLHGLLADLPSDPTAAAAQWNNWAPLLGALTESMVRFDANVVRNDYVFAQLVAWMASRSRFPFSSFRRLSELRMCRSVRRAMKRLLVRHLAQPSSTPAAAMMC